MLKNGATSTLAIVQGIKDALPKIQETLPSALKIVPIGDQSLFVKAAISGRDQGRRDRSRAHQR